MPSEYMDHKVGVASSQSSIILICSVKQQRELLISFRCFVVNGIDNRCTGEATIRDSPEEEWFYRW